MSSFLVFLVVLNAGFLLGAWWGADWRRRDHARLRDEVVRLRRELGEAQDAVIIPLHDVTTTQAG